VRGIVRLARGKHDQKVRGIYGAQERIRTSTPLRALDHEFNALWYFPLFPCVYVAWCCPYLAESWSAFGCVKGRSGRPKRVGRDDPRKRALIRPWREASAVGGRERLAGRIQPRRASTLICRGHDVLQQAAIRNPRRRDYSLPRTWPPRSCQAFRQDHRTQPAEIGR